MLIIMLFLFISCGKVSEEAASPVPKEVNVDSDMDGRKDWEESSQKSDPNVSNFSYVFKAPTGKLSFLSEGALKEIHIKSKTKVRLKILNHLYESSSPDRPTILQDLPDLDGAEAELAGERDFWELTLQQTTVRQLKIETLEGQTADVWFQGLNGLLKEGKLTLDFPLKGLKLKSRWSDLSTVLKFHSRHENMWDKFKDECYRLIVSYPGQDKVYYVSAKLNPYVFLKNKLKLDFTLPKQNESQWLVNLSLPVEDDPILPGKTYLMAVIDQAELNDFQPKKVMRPIVPADHQLIKFPVTPQRSHGSILFFSAPMDYLDESVKTVKKYCKKTPMAILTHSKNFVWPKFYRLAGFIEMKDGQGAGLLPDASQYKILWSVRGPHGIVGEMQFSYAGDFVHFAMDRSFYRTEVRSGILKNVCHATIPASEMATSKLKFQNFTIGAMTF